MTHYIVVSFTGSVSLSVPYAEAMNYVEAHPVDCPDSILDCPHLARHRKVVAS